MASLIHADIFFFISSIGFIILFVIGIVAAVYVVGILKSVRHISRTLEHDVDALSDDARAFFGDIRDSGIYRMLFGKKHKAK